MPADLRVTDKSTGKVYEIDVAQTLEDLTGEETLAVEEFLGGWENFDQTGESARSFMLLYWLAKRGSGEKITLKDVLQEKGLLFGNRVDLEDMEDDSDSPPAEAPAEGATHSTPSVPSVVSGAGLSPNATE